MDFFSLSARAREMASEGFSGVVGLMPGVYICLCLRVLGRIRMLWCRGSKMRKLLWGCRKKGAPRGN